MSLSELVSINLVVGANNAGKSSVLEAAALVLRPSDPAQWVTVARQRDVDMGLVDGLWSLFPSNVALQVDDGPKQTKPLRVKGVVAGLSRKLTASGLASVNWDKEESEDLTLRVETSVFEAGNPPNKHTMEFRSRRVEMLGDVSRDEWEQILDAYPIGTIVNVLVRPAKPSLAVLRSTPDQRFRGQFVFFALCLLMTIALTCLIVSNPGTDASMIPF